MQEHIGRARVIRRLARESAAPISIATDERVVAHFQAISPQPFCDGSFDLVLAINTIHNLPYEECRKSLQEIQRVSRRYAFVMVDAYRTNDEREAMLKWVLSAETMLHVEEWRQLFAQAGYTGDYYWWIVE